MSETKILETRLLSSLSKVFAEDELKDAAFKQGTALLGETYSFQFAYKATQDFQRELEFMLKTDLPDGMVQLRSVGLAPAELPSYGYDDNYLKDSAGLYPDPILPIEGDFVRGFVKQWRSFWITVNIPEDFKPGNYNIEVGFVVGPEGEKENLTETFSLEVLGAKLPEQKLLHTEWFHTDCIATIYGVDVWSEKHWELTGKFIQNAVDHGINTILTPLFTPPLDTKVGGERPTVQLIGVKKDGDGYTFDFSKLERWVELCNKCGVLKFEFSHFFTQWGAEKTPKIVAEVNGKEEKIFGWHVDSCGLEYRNFMSQFLPQLVDFIKKNNLEERSLFHISDEPSKNHIDSYKECLSIVEEYLEGFTIIDALSDVQFYKDGVIKNPVPANNHIEPFIEAGFENRWTYYCCSQWDTVPNRFFAMPSERNRSHGILAFVYDLKGFLHWGFNFWYTQHSIKPIDPFRVTDAGTAFPSGDAFLVYPGEDGPVDSIRHEVFTEGLQDLRALRLLESKIGRKATLEFIHEDFDSQMTMTNYPKGKDWYLNFREKLNRKLTS